MRDRESRERNIEKEGRDRESRERRKKEERRLKLLNLNHKITLFQGAPTAFQSFWCTNIDA